MPRAPALIALTAVLTGCSWIAVPGVHARGPYRDDRIAQTCTSSHAAPYSDTAVVILGVLAIVGAGATLLDDTSGAPDGGPYVLALGLGAASVVLVPIFATSARHGYRHVGRCQAEQRKPPEPA